MPVYEIELNDGRKFEVEADSPPSEADVMSALGDSTAAPAPAGTPDQEPEGSGGGLDATALGLTAARAVPGIARGAGRFIAAHPAAAQKAIGAGVSSIAGGIGAGVGGVPGAVVGASIRGVTPAQSVIRETAGRLAGEAPAVARNAGRAVAVANYAKEAGLPLKPTQLVSTGNAARALDSYAESMGQRVPRILDQFGKVVVGPEAPPQQVARRLPGIVTRTGGMLGRAAKLVTGPGTSALLASTEVNRRLNSPEVLSEINELRLPKQERAHQNDARDRILARFAEMLGLQ